MGNLLRCLTKEHGLAWDVVLPQAEFSFNDLVNRSIGLTPFQIVYGGHPRGVLELRDLGDSHKRSAQAEDFAEVMKDIHKQVKDKLDLSVRNYKAHADKKRRDLHFQVGDLVMIHLRKERMPREKYTKLMMKKRGPFKILKKCGYNAYHIDLPTNLWIFPIFSVADIYAFKGPKDNEEVEVVQQQEESNLLQELPQVPKPTIEAILGKRKTKKTRRKQYYEYLVKWENKPIEDASWLSENDIL